MTVVCRFEVGLHDRVLLDAPCTSERHVVQAAMEAGGVVSSSSWSGDQCSNMAALQIKVRPAGGLGDALLQSLHWP
jgi:16S rRNA C967 or C1407 C5-methylase (RsmB/RsmF family)